MAVLADGIPLTSVTKLMKLSEFEILRKSQAQFLEDQKKLLQNKSEFEFFDGIIGSEIFDGITGIILEQRKGYYNLSRRRGTR